MKKLMAALLLSALLVQQSKACDICGNVNHLNPYLFPHLSKSYFGVAYLHNRYHSLEDGMSSYINSQTLLLTGQYTLNSRVQFMLMAPYQFSQTKAGYTTSRKSGMGDVTVLANYNLLRMQTGAVAHTLSLGAGVKLATGKFNADKSSELNSENVQLGSGSFDYLANAVYRLSVGNVGLAAVATYKYTTANAQGYRYGDALTAGATGYYIIRTKGLAFTPYLQVVNESHYRDADQHVLQSHSGGSVLYAGGGLDATVSKVTVGANYQAVARQDLMHGELLAKPKFSARISFTL